jgi:hypothetical protein
MVGSQGLRMFRRRAAGGAPMCSSITQSPGAFATALGAYQAGG